MAKPAQLLGRNVINCIFVFLITLFDSLFVLILHVRSLFTIPQHVLRDLAYETQFRL